LRDFLRQLGASRHSDHLLAGELMQSAPPSINEVLMRATDLHHRQCQLSLVQAGHFL
jgi:hypothetical protein